MEIFYQNKSSELPSTECLMGGVIFDSNFGSRDLIECFE